MKDCLICKWMKERKNVVCYIGNVVILIPDLSYVKYHLLVCPKKHYESIFDIPEDEYNELFLVTRKIGRLLEDTLNADATRYTLNNNHWNVSKSKLHIKHIHVQVFPCFGKLSDITGNDRRKLTDNEIKKTKEDILRCLKPMNWT